MDVRKKLAALTLPATLLLLAGAALLEIWARPLPGSKALLVATALLYSLPLAASRAYPLQSVAVALLALDVMAVFARSATREAGAPELAGLAALFLVALYGAKREALVGFAFAMVTVALVARDEPSVSSGIVTFFLTTALAAVVWGIGYALRERRTRADEAERRALEAERERQTAARIAVAEERARIARELHDVVAHSVSVMVLQAGAVRSKLPPEPRVHQEALASIEQAGRSALAEMRRVLDATWGRDDGETLAPQPALADLPQLVEGVERAGLPVEVRVEGQAVSLPRGLDLSAYRIVQEALTNVLKHARAAQAEVRLAYGSQELTIEVSDDGAGAAASDDGRGHGLAGIAERVKIYGGEMAAAPQPDGGFRLRARLPLAPDDER